MFVVYSKEKQACYLPVPSSLPLLLIPLLLSPPQTLDWLIFFWGLMSPLSSSKVLYYYPWIALGLPKFTIKPIRDRISRPKKQWNKVSRQNYLNKVFEKTSWNNSNTALLIQRRGRIVTYIYYMKINVH